MDSNKMTRAEMIEWLGNAISAETDKPFEDIDYDFVDECGQLLDELIGVNHITEEEAAKKAARLKSKLNKREKKVLKPRRLIRILVAAAIVMCMSVTVLAIPQLRVMISQALKLDVGETIYDGEISYTHGGKTTYYSSIDELISQNNLDILSFGTLPDGITVSSVIYIDDSDTTVITFTDPTINFQILHNNSYISDSIKNNSEKYSAELFDAYIFSKEINSSTQYYSYFSYHNCLYIINCESQTTLMTILTELKEGE